MTSAAGAVVDMMVILLFQGCGCCLICDIKIQLVKNRRKAPIYNANRDCKVADMMIDCEKTVALLVHPLGSAARKVFVSESAANSGFLLAYKY